MTTKNNCIEMTVDEAIKWLDKLNGGPLTIGSIIKATRRCHLINQIHFAKKLKTPKKRLSDIENNKIIPSLNFIAKCAKILGYDKESFYMILEDQLKRNAKGNKQKEIDISINIDQLINFISSRKETP